VRCQVRLLDSPVCRDKAHWDWVMRCPKVDGGFRKVCEVWTCKEPEEDDDDEYGDVRDGIHQTC
jgi:hypothetical protein